MLGHLKGSAAIFFAQELRCARARALADAEDWQELVFVFERLVKFTTINQRTTLRDSSAKRALRDIALGSEDQRRLTVTNYDSLFDQVTRGRNSEFHGGAAARRFVRHCVEFAFLLEDGLRQFMDKNLGAVMSSPVLHVEPWRMLADVLAGTDGLRTRKLRIFSATTMTTEKDLLHELANGPILVSSSAEFPDRIVGIVTAFDLL